MRALQRRVGLAGLLLAAACANPLASVPSGRIVDLSWAYDASTIYWPTDEEGFVMEFGPEGVTPDGYYYEAHRFRTAEHGGTHIDAPIHFHKDRWRLDEIPLRRLIGEGVVVDVSEQVAADPDHRVDLMDLLEWERLHGRIPSGAIVLLRTGFGEYWPDRKLYLGTEKRGKEALAELHFPGLGDEAARWLVLQRRVKAVGIDTASIDHGPSTLFETHQTLFEYNVPAFENLANLSELPPRDFLVVALPMKIAGGSGGPLRIIAIVP